MLLLVDVLLMSKVAAQRGAAQEDLLERGFNFIDRRARRGHALKG